MEDGGVFVIAPFICRQTVNMTASAVRNPTLGRLSRWLCWLVSIFLGATVMGVEPVLTTAREVRSLTVEKAAQKLPVELRGTVIFIEGPNGAIVLQDGTAGTYFRGRNEMTLQPGDEVRVKGVTTPGSYLPGIEQSTYEKLERRDLPAAIAVTYGDLVSGRCFFQCVAMEGIVQAVKATPDGSRSILSLGMGEDLLEVRVCVPPQSGQRLVDSRVRIEGVASGGINQRRQLVQPIAWVHDWSGVQVLEPALPENQVPVMSAGQLLAFDAVGQKGHCVRVKGVVIAAFPEGQVFIRDETTALLVQLPAPPPLIVGAQIEVMGFPKMQHFSAVLINATITRQETGTAPSAIEVGVEDLTKGMHDHDLVSVTGVLSGYFQEEDGDVLLLQDKGRTIRTQVASLDQGLAPGARVHVTGICTVESNTASGLESRPRTVSLRCRGVADVIILEAASWWTAQRLAIAVGVLLLVITVAGLWIALLRRQVRRQTQALRQQIEHEAALEERQRIAREFHDTLEQGLTGLALRLEGVQARGIDEKNGHLLRASRRLISQIQAETRSLVTELREPAPELSDIATALRTLAEEHPAGCSPTLTFTLKGSASIPPLPSRTVHHLRMIAREAVTNALKHARAERVELSLAVDNQVLRMRITDDGCGFDPAAPRGGRGGHFGCIGIEERCEKLGARVHWRSSTGTGTSVEIELPLHPVKASLTP